MLNKTQLLQHCQQDYDLINKIKGWCAQARQGKIVATGFLDLRQLAILTAILRQEKITDYSIHEPFVNGFRKTVTFNSTQDNTIILTTPQPTPTIFTTSSCAGVHFKPVTVRFACNW